MMFDRGFMALPTCVALVAVLVVCLAQRVGMRRTCLYLVLTVYVGAVAAVTLFPLPVGLQLGSPQDQVVVWGATINLVPFAGIARTVADAAQTGWWWTIAVTIVGGNVLMFVPLGFMPPLLSERFHRFRTTLFVLVACSAAIELAQLTVGLAVVGGLYRVVDVDDVILNVVGGSIGFGLWKASLVADDAQTESYAFSSCWSSSFSSVLQASSAHLTRAGMRAMDSSSAASSRSARSSSVSGRPLIMSR